MRITPDVVAAAQQRAGSMGFVVPDLSMVAILKAAANASGEVADIIEPDIRFSILEKEIGEMQRFIVDLNRVVQGVVRSMTPTGESLDPRGV